MAKLYFRYGTVHSGKSTALLQAAHNYESRGMKVLLITPKTDTRGAGTVVSRIGLSRQSDIQSSATDNLHHFFNIHESTHTPIACVLVDEVQFLASAQIDQLLKIVIDTDTPVICYGLRTDFTSELFPGSSRLLAIAHSIEELKTVCRCGKKATFSARKTGNQYVFSGEQLAIEERETSYEGLCPICFRDEYTHLINTRKL